MSASRRRCSSSPGNCNLPADNNNLIKSRAGIDGSNKGRAVVGAQTESATSANQIEKSENSSKEAQQISIFDQQGSVNEIETVFDFDNSENVDGDTADTFSEEGGELVGFSTGDDELDLLINGKSDGFERDDSKKGCVDASSSGGSVVVDDVEKEKTLKNEDDYSYYGTIKPLAENAGHHEKPSKSCEKIESKKIEANLGDDFKVVPELKIEAEKRKNDFSRIENALNKAKTDVLANLKCVETAVTRVYDDIFKNNPSFKNSIESVLKNFEEYVQALLLSTMMESGVDYDKFPDFVYEVLPLGNIFGGTSDELSAKIKIAAALKSQPLALLMLAAVDVAMGQQQTKMLIDRVYDIYCVCVAAIDKKPFTKDEVLFNLISFAKNQGVKI